MHKQTLLGFTLIEILVAMSLVSIAMLLSLNGQFITRQASQEYQYKSIAMRHASELAAWIGLVDEFSRNGFDSEKNIPTLMGEILSSNETRGQIDCFYADCSLQQQLQFDFNNWRHRLQLLVPGVRVVVCRDDQAWHSESRTWRWDCGGDELSPTVIKIGWPLTATNHTFAPAVVLTVGPILI